MVSQLRLPFPSLKENASGGHYRKNVSIMMLNVFMLLYHSISLRTHSGYLSHVLPDF